MMKLRITAAAIAMMILFGASSECYALGRIMEDEAPYSHYSVDGCEIDFSLTMYLQEKLAQADMEWFMPYAVCQMYQESSADPTQLTPYSGGNDCGLYQIRDKYFEYYAEEAGVTGDIMDPRTQIDIYVTITARRLAAGESIEKAISDWTTGGENRICEVYVKDVLSWKDRLEVRR